MIANFRLTRPESLIFYPATENNVRKNAARKSLPRPEDRLWKLSTQTAPDFRLIESFVMLILAVMALAAIGECFFVLSHLLQADAIQHIVVQTVKPSGTVVLPEPFNFPLSFQLR
jgi:hypothetical protein